MSLMGAGGERPERALPIFLSVLVHAGVVALLGWGWWSYRAPKPVPQQLAIEATIVIDKAVTPAPAASAAAAAQPAPIPAPAPTPAPVPAPVPAKGRRGHWPGYRGGRTDDQMARRGG